MKALQTGFAAMAKDPQMLTEMRKVDLDVAYAPPEKLTDEVEKTLATPDAVKKRAKDLLAR